MTASAQATAAVKPENSFTYLFEAKGVQRWLFDSGPMRDLIGASDLVSGLASSDGDDLVSDVLKAVGIDVEPPFSRRAGGAFCLHWHDLEQLEAFRALWRLAVGLACPGLECSDVLLRLAADEVAGIEAAYKAGTGVRFNGAVELPPKGHPFTFFNPRTGRLATRLYCYGRGGTDQTLVDVVSEAHRRHTEDLARRFVDRGRYDRVSRRFLSQRACATDPPYVFPRNLEDDEFRSDEEGESDPGRERETHGDFGNPSFPFIDEDRRLAVIHADLSGLGQIFRRATRSARNAREVREVAEAIERVVEGAAQDATDTLLGHEDLRPYGSKALRVLPARPVLLGGDDITILVRADLAFEFAETLLTSIEQRSEVEFEAFADRDLRVDRVSACAGLAVVKSGQPFLMANGLAENLVKRAKIDAKKHEAAYPSFLAFHVAQTTLAEKYSDIVDRELTARIPHANGEAEIVSLTGNPYRVGSTTAAGERGFCDLQRLARALAAAPQGRGKLIEAGRHLFGDADEAERNWTRWRDVLNLEDAEKLLAVDEALRALEPSAEPALRSSIGAINDALELIDLGVVTGESSS